MERGKKIVRVSLLGIAVNLVLVAFKAAVGWISGSIAIMMDAVNNLSDALSSVITIIGAKLAGRQPDKKHPYGHGRIEYITSITIAVIVLLAGVTSFKESFEKILDPQSATYSAVTIIIIAVAVLAKLLLGRYVKRTGKKIHSESLVASGTDALFDAVISLSTLVGAAVSRLFSLSIEGYLGVLISVVILKAGVEILMDSLSSIIGARVDSELSTRLKADICAYPQVLGAYDLILHSYGPERIIGSVHVEVPDDMTAKEIHNLTRHIAEDVYLNYGIILTVGVYASNMTDETIVAMKDRLNALIADYPEVLQMHGFYVDTERMLVSFDLILDFKAKDKAAIRDSILSAMAADWPDYHFVAVLDNDYSD